LLLWTTLGVMALVVESFPAWKVEDEITVGANS
jgi:hypothetical protein